MLRSVTKKFLDKSTKTHFEFEFFCDCCGKTIPTPVLEFINGFADEKYITDEQRQARDILYSFEHNNAYERANIEARFELDRCAKCGDMVCFDCSFFADDNGLVLCRKCINDKN